jgi:hypothetical protein
MPTPDGNDHNFVAFIQYGDDESGGKRAVRVVRVSRHVLARLQALVPRVQTIRPRVRRWLT